MACQLQFQQPSARHAGWSPLTLTARKLLRLLLLSLWLLAGGESLYGQALSIEGAGNATPQSQSAPRLEMIGSRARRLLAQFDALVTPPDRQPDEKPAGDDPAAVDWDEALNLLEDLLATDATKLVADETEPGRFVTLSDHCHAKIAALPGDGRQAYRDRVDPAARQLLDEGRDRRDQRLLQRVVNDYFNSSWTDDALLLLGDLALERGDSTAARRCWRRITPLASGPTGRPLAWSLRGVDLDQHGAAVVEILTKSNNLPFTCVDSDVPIADILARLSLAATIDRRPAEAICYAKLLRLLAPEASGVLAGRQGPLAETLDGLLAAAKDWPTAGAGETIGPLRGRMWPRPVALLPTNQPRTPVRPIFLGNGFRQPQAPAPLVGPFPECLPTVAAGVVVYRDRGVLRVVSLADGRPTLAPDGVLYQPIATTNLDTRPAALNGRVINRAVLASRLVPLPTDERFAVRGDQLFARVHRGHQQNAASRPMIRAFDLRREGLSAPIVEPVEAPWQIGGAPTLDGTRLYAPLSVDDITPRLGLAAFSTTTGRELWRTPIATAAASRTYGRAAPPPTEATLAGDTLYLNTNAGAIAAIDKQTGAIRWVRTYNRRVDEPARIQLTAARRGASRCLVTTNRVIVAPRDSDHLFALDAATGRLLWATEPLRGDFHLLGATGGVLVVGGDQLRGFDLDTGRACYTWPESRKAGLRGMGHGCLVADEVFWPTRTRLFALDAIRGVQTRESIDIADIGATGANVTPAGKQLLVTGAKAMTLLGPDNREQPEQKTLLSLLD